MSCFTKSFTLFVMTLLPILVGAQTCQTNSILATTPTNRFTINNDGTVSDTKTGLTWKKCSEGQSGADCRTGAAKTYTWQGALQQAQSVNNSGGTGNKNWRLPDIKELDSIVEEQCFKPSINIAIFPESQSNVYWSSSSILIYGSGSVMTVNFDEGGSNGYLKNGSYFVRLVHDNQPLANTAAYTKISNSGATLPDTAVLGSGSNDWACTKDNKTGLTWEVKTDDGGLRDWNKSYTNYFLGVTSLASDNSGGFIDAVNKKSLCGSVNWRLPTSEELKNLVLCSDGKYNSVGREIYDYICTNYNSVIQPTINATYFPNTKNYFYWTSSIITNVSNAAWYVDFMLGVSNGSILNSGGFTRLVH